MPHSAPRGCRFPGCGALVGRGELCHEHKGLVETADDRRPGASRRGYDRHWRGLRVWFLHRHPLCQWPGCRMPASNVDHIVPLSKGGAKSDPDNLQSLCHKHHSIKSCRFDGGFGRKPIRPNACGRAAKTAKNANRANYPLLGSLDAAGEPNEERTRS